jgi:hypothetical protein
MKFPSGPLQCLAALLAVLPAALPATEIGVKESGFLLDGKAVFLHGLSYYGALGASEETVRRDLDDMEGHGIRWLRVWATWAAFGADVSAVDSAGAAREPFLGNLRRLVAECDRRGLVVDVTLSRGNGAVGPPRLQTLEAHRRAVETVMTALKPYRNWYLDLANERNVEDKRFVSFEELGELRGLARELDPRRLVTASHGGDIDREDLRSYLETARVDFIAPHRPRHAGSAAETEARTRELLGWMRELGRAVPVHYQEPFRRGYARWQPAAADFAADARGARAGGAAGWCLHNGDQKDASGSRPRRSFDLGEKRLFDQLDEEERKALKELRP